jgi:hypothetical protein
MPPELSESHSRGIPPTNREGNATSYLFLSANFWNSYHVPFPFFGAAGVARSDHGFGKPGLFFTSAICWLCRTL